MKIKAGDLNKRLTFQTNTPTANSIGEMVNVYTDYVTVWGALHPFVGSRAYQEKQINVSATGQAVIRYRNDLNVTMRIKYGNRYFTILSMINPDEANDSLEIKYAEALD